MSARKRQRENERKRAREREGERGRLEMERERYNKNLRDRHLIVILKTLSRACWSGRLDPIHHPANSHRNEITIKICSILSRGCLASINFFPSILHPINQKCCGACNGLWGKDYGFMKLMLQNSLIHPGPPYLPQLPSASPQQSCGLIASQPPISDWFCTR